ncbi:unnamed protein product, partial [Timema podura]|nr:unnamed protein product [Timema podura]
VCEDPTCKVNLEKYIESYGCPACSLKFYTAESLMEHLDKLNGREGALSCCECKKNFCNYSLLQKHEATHLTISAKKQTWPNTSSGNQGAATLLETNATILVEKDASMFVETDLTSGYRKIMPKPNLGNFMCPICGSRFATTEELDKHTARLEDSSQCYVCWECKMKLCDFLSLLKHERMHLNAVKKLIKPSKHSFMCPNCDMQFLTGQQRKEHLKKLNDSDLCHACGECKKKFCNLSSLLLHESHHQDGSTSNNYLCEICGKVIQTRSGYSRHLLTHSRDKTFACDWCDKSFIYKKSLDIHMYSHPLRVDYSCFDCSLAFTDFSGLKSHMKAAHTDETRQLSCNTCGKSWDVPAFLDHYKLCHLEFESKIADKRRKNVTCPKCSKVFSQPAAVRRHLKLHNAGKKHHTCEVCGAVIVKRNEMIEHAKSHYGDTLPEKYINMMKMLEKSRAQALKYNRKDCICEYCGMKFNKNANLQMHLRRHTGDKAHKCELCGRGFHTKQRLKFHVELHSGERIYSCAKCPREFSNKQEYEQHNKLHTVKARDIQCPHCEQKLSKKQTFLAHLRLHTGERPYVCNLCPKRFISKTSLYTHNKLKHPPELVAVNCTQEMSSGFMYKDMQIVVIPEEEGNEMSGVL